MSCVPMAVGFSNNNADHDFDERRFSDPEITADDRTITSLNLDDTEKTAARPLTGGHGVVVRSYTSSPHYLPLAVVTFFVNPFFGLTAILCACLSRSHRSHGDDRRASSLGKASFWVSITGLALAVVIGVFAAVYINVIIPNIIRVYLLPKPSADGTANSTTDGTTNFNPDGAFRDFVFNRNFPKKLAGDSNNY